MSRQSGRQRLPPDDDLEGMTEEEKRRRAEAAARTARPSSAMPVAGPARAPHAGDRAAYFSGRYSSTSPAGSGPARMSPEMIAERRLAEFGLPDSLRHCVADLIRILRDHGLGEALAALESDPAIDKQDQGPIGRLLATLDQGDRRPSG